MSTAITMATFEKVGDIAQFTSTVTGKILHANEHIYIVGLSTPASDSVVEEIKKTEGLLEAKKAEIAKWAKDNCYVIDDHSGERKFMFAIGLLENGHLFGIATDRTTFTSITSLNLYSNGHITDISLSGFNFNSNRHVINLGANDMATAIEEYNAEITDAITAGAPVDPTLRISDVMMVIAKEG